MKDIDLVAYIGRFSLPHDGHIYTVGKALEQGKHVIILVGSADEPRNKRNPWTFEERKTMLELAIRDKLGAEALFNVTIESHHNFINMLPWTLQIQQRVYDCARRVFPDVDEPKIRLIGYKKDNTSFYLDSFPQWNPMITVEHYNVLNATDIRDQYFLEGTINDHVSPRVANYLEVWKRSEGYDYVRKEYEFQERHDKAWEGAPYAPIFHCVDAVVVQSGHILMIRRRNHPGKGTWALPGGYIAPDESLRTSMIRELREETKIKVPEKVLLGSIKKEEQYDDPCRSTRGRILTRAFLVELQDDPNGLPRVKGADDAEKAKWVTIYDFMQMRDQMFEDHFLICRDLLGI